MLDWITSQAAQAALTDLAELIVSVAVVAGVWLLNKYTGIKLSDAAVARLKSGAATEAGALVAMAEDNLRNRRVTTSDMSIAKAADNIAERNPDAVDRTKITDETLRKFVVGEVGKLQAAQAEVKPVVVPVGEVK